ncbi:MAG: HupE/UreJ family protein [Flavobacteriales bacterium]
MNTIVDGILHITDFEGYDHMLFLLALSAPFGIKDIKKLLLLITAFTIGHSITLILAGLQIISFSSNFVELVISISIAITALLNFFAKPGKLSLFRYAVVFGFGLIHGMGFSSFFKMMISDNENYLGQLLLFNLGVELGQIIILGVILLISMLALKWFKVKSKMWNFGISIVALIISGYLIFEKIG